jgi:hypothetical protein
MSEKILSGHPKRKSGRSIRREKHDQVRDAMLATTVRGQPAPVR